MGPMAEVKGDLLNYLLYMQQLGLDGLELEDDPFAPRAVPPRPVAKAPPRATKKPAPPARKAPPKPTMPAMSRVLDLVADQHSAAETRTTAESISGKNAEETLVALYNAFQSCQACALGPTRTRFVFGEGPPDAELMFVGEGPGREEDRTGRPFVGDAGQLLTRIIQAMGFQRHDVFIANIVKCRPPGNRNPLPDEMATCAPILVKQIETIQPKIIVALGSVAYRYFKGKPGSIVRNRGVYFTWRDYQVMPTFHPAYILRNPSAKRDVWEDMQKVMQSMKEAT